MAACEYVSIHVATALAFKRQANVMCAIDTQKVIET